jgi:hypothetical protein
MKIYMKKLLLGFILSYRTWLILSMLFVSNLFFEAGYYHVQFNTIELTLAIVSVVGLILTSFFGKKIENFFKL